MGWMEGSKGEEQTSLWPQNNPTDADLANILEAENEDWYITTTTSHHHQQPPPDLSFSPSFTEAAADISNQQLFLPSVDSSASCTSPASASVFNNNNNQVNYFLQPNNPLDQAGGFDLGFESNGGLFGCGFNELGLNNNALFGTSNIGFGSLQGVGNSLMVFNNRCNKILKPLDHNFGAQPTLFQKRAALRKTNINNNNNNNSNNNVEVISGSEERERKSKNGDDVEDLISIDGSNLNYDSDEGFLESSGVVNKVEEDGGGAAKGKKKKGLPAKNLMAERRRRKKLNDRLYMLRSVVPKISKMDRASILGDAIDYLKELLQKINDLHNELESIPGSSTTSSFYPLTPTTPGAAARIKEELCPTAFATPLSSPTAQPPRVEVRLKEGKAVNIHMFCGRKPGILLSTLRAIDNLGLDVQQAVISCFNAFALDIFRAEQRGEGQEINPDHIKALLLDSAGFHGML